jgi:nucleoside phosphorylase
VLSFYTDPTPLRLIRLPDRPATMSSKPTTYGCESYTVAWIAALPLELAAATAVLDEEYERPADFEQHQHDTNTYTWGRVGNHNVVIASLPTGEYGTTIAATTASSLRFSLPQVRFGLMVGIGAGIPQLEHNEDVRFGDIVVSQPQDSSGGVIQYDLVKAKEGGKFLTGHLAMPPEALRKALAKLQAQHEMRDSAVPSILKDMILKFPKMAKQTAKKPGYVYQGAENDRLFVASSDHLGGIDCRACREVDVVPRDQRDSTDPEIHYGIIASGNTLVKKAADRDEILGRLPKHVQNKCLCRVIRGICDYGDSHKNDRWQRYAAATAAAFAKEFLSFVDAKEVKSAPELRDLLESR